MSASAIGVDCCGDRYPCNTTEACNCGCGRFYCATCFISHHAKLYDYNDTIWRRFHDAEWTDLWYAHPGPGRYFKDLDDEKCKRFGGRWFAGVWTGPEHDLICVKSCVTNEEAKRFLSPGGYTPVEAVELALAKLTELTKQP